MWHDQILGTSLSKTIKITCLMIFMNNGTQRYKNISYFAKTSSNVMINKPLTTLTLYKFNS